MTVCRTVREEPERAAKAAANRVTCEHDVAWQSSVTDRALSWRAAVAARVRKVSASYDDCFTKKDGT